MPLVIPVIIMGGILTGWFTPTEAGLVAVVYILVVAIPVLNWRHIRELPLDFAKAGLLYSIPLITVAAASAFGWMLAYLRGPDLVSDWITTAAGTDPMTIMFLLVGAFVIIGDFVDAIPAIIIFMPIINKLTEIGEHQPGAYGRRHHRDFGLRADHAALWHRAADGVEIRRGPVFGWRWCARCRFTSFSSRSSRSASCFPDVVLWIPKHVLPESVGCFKNPAGTGYICPRSHRGNDRDVVDQAGAAETGGDEQPRRAVEPAHRRQIGGIAQFEVIRHEAGLAQPASRVRRLAATLSGVAAIAAAVSFSTRCSSGATRRSSGER